MYDINEINTIYYGTKIENLELLLKGINEPITREEKYLSISVSGYIGKVSIHEHEELHFLSKIYSNEYKAARINNGLIEWKKGYKNSITFIDGFGPNDTDFYNEFGTKKKNDRIGQNICIVISSKYINEVIYPNKCEVNEFEYLSLALHPYINKISLKNVEGIITDKYNYQTVITYLEDHKLNKQVWKVEEIEET